MQACATVPAQQGSQKGAPSAALPVSSTSGVCMATCKLLKAWQQHPTCLRTQGGGESYPCMCMTFLAPLECGLTSMYVNHAVTAVLQQMHEMLWISACEKGSPALSVRSSLFCYYHESTSCMMCCLAHTLVICALWFTWAISCLCNM